MRADKKGVTLSETLLALGIASVASLLAGSLLLASARWSARIDGHSHETQLARLAVELLRLELSQAGRGRGALADAVTLTLRDTPEGDRVTVRYDSPDHGDAYRNRDADFFVAPDGEGRMNLYRQALGSRRQPWLLGIQSMTVQSARDTGGHVIDRAAMPSAAVAALRISVTLTSGVKADGWVSLARAGVREAADVESPWLAAVR